MTELLTPEEREALRQPQNGAPQVLRAVFPSVSQLDPDRLASLETGLNRWLTLVAAAIGEQCRIRCLLGETRTETRMSPPSADGDVVVSAVVASCTEAPVEIALPAGLAVGMCERLFGAPFVVAQPRALTVLESSTLRTTVETWVRLLPQALPLASARLLPADTARDQQPEDSSPVWTCYLATLDGEAAGGQITVALQPAAARALLGEARTQARSGISVEALAGSLGDMELELSVVLGECELALRDLSSLRIGDVIPLRRRAEEPFDVVVEGRPFLKGRPTDAEDTIILEVVGLAGEEQES